MPNFRRGQSVNARVASAAWTILISILYEVDCIDCNFCWCGGVMMKVVDETAFDILCIVVKL